MSIRPMAPCTLVLLTYVKPIEEIDRLRPAHVEWLKAGPVQLAGPLIEDGEMRGSLLVIEADSLGSATAWAAGDPYKAAGLFASVEVIEWKKVIG